MIPMAFLWGFGCGALFSAVLLFLWAGWLEARHEAPAIRPVKPMVGSYYGPRHLTGIEARKRAFGPRKGGDV